MAARSGPTVPLLYRLVRDRTGQSETLGVVLLLGIAVVGTAAIVAFGSTALNETKQASQLQRTEHAMTLFDSRAAMVALGESPQQTIDLAGTGGGEYTVKQGTGRIRVVHYNYTGKGGKEVIYNNTLGELVYKNGDTKIGYQGGGVWRKNGNDSSMVSPPEFHFRQSTLTLPVIRVLGDDSASGSASVTIDAVQQARRVFPNATNDSTLIPNTGAPYDDWNADGTDGPPHPYVNPIQNGTVWVYVTSDYYQGWAEFFRSRSDGKVKVWHSNDTAAMELVGGGKVGDFEMPANGNSIDVGGMADGHTVENYTVVLTDDGGDNANFDNLQWSMWAEEGSLQWEAHIRNGHKACKGGAPYDTEYADLYVYFSDSSGASYQAWKNESSVPIECKDFDDDGDMENVLTLNLTSQTNDMTYMDSKPKLNHFNPSGSPANDVEWNVHEDSVSWEPITWSYGETTPVDNTTNHYLTQFSNSFKIHIDDKSSNTVSESQSSGTLTYGGGGQIYITYLHITENEIRVEF